jgi:hypothetical protein
MKIHFIITILILVQIKIYSQNNTGKFVSEEWITSSLKNENSVELIKNFEASFPSEASKKNEIDKSTNEPYLSLTKINLDDDEGSEYVLFIGSNYSRTMFYVIDDNFKILYQEYLWLFNDYPQLIIYNSRDQHKTLSFRYLYGRGSGHWLFSKRFFKVFEGKVYLVLEVADDSNDTFNFRGINGRIELKEINEYNGGFYLSYSYNIYPHQKVLEYLGIEDENYSLIKKEKQSLIYIFNETEKKFILTGIDKTSIKDKYFFEPGNDSLFIKAFVKELDNIESTGTDIDKKVVKFLRGENKN